jgi:heme/copper-type cytochrome/quinol oxidase subunit 2
VRRGLLPAAVLLLAAVTGLPASPEVVELVASREGFRPKVVNARKGDALRLRLSSADDEHCFALDAFRVEKRIRPGRTVTVDLTLERAGTYPFYCCLETGEAAQVQHGRLVVVE